MLEEYKRFCLEDFKRIFRGDFKSRFLIRFLIGKQTLKGMFNALSVK
jgi:hypothetical protein